MTPTLIISLAVGLGLLIGTFLLLRKIGSTTRKERLDAIKERKESLRRDFMSGKKRVREQEVADDIFLKISRALQLRKIFNEDAIREKLMMAGWRKLDTINKIMVAQLFAPIIFFLYTGFLCTSGPLAAKSLMIKVVALIAALAIGYYLPTILIKNAAVKREKKLNDQFSEALDLMIVSADAGCSIEQAFNFIIDEMGDVVPELAEELAITTAELSFLRERKNAYENLAKRNSMRYFKILANTLIQAEKYGTSISDSLRVLSEENKRDRTNRIEEKGAKVGTKMTPILICFILPALILTVVGPIIVKFHNMGVEREAKAEKDKEHATTQLPPIPNFPTPK